MQLGFSDEMLEIISLDELIPFGLGLSSGLRSIQVKATIVRKIFSELVDNGFVTKTMCSGYGWGFRCCYNCFAWMSQLPVAETEVTPQSLFGGPETIRLFSQFERTLDKLLEVKCKIVFPIWWHKQLAIWTNCFICKSPIDDVKKNVM